jgi:hypothetical protein
MRVVSAIWMPGISSSGVPDKLWFRSRKEARIGSRRVAAEGKSVARSASMAKAIKTKGFEKLEDPEKHPLAGPGGATHETAEAAQGFLGTEPGVVIADNQNTLKSGERGPSLLPAKQQGVWAREARLLKSA